MIAEPDPRWGEVGLAMVVPREPGRLTAEDVLAYCRAASRASRSQARRLRRRLPRNAMGKVIKTQLYVEFVEGATAGVTAESQGTASG